MEILIPILTLGSLGLVFGVGLAIASKKLAVHVDPRLERVHGLLPGSNCGACGGAGCFGFAEMLLSGKASPEGCRVSEESIQEKIAELLGKKVSKRLRTTARLHCGGGRLVKDRFNYSGIEDCLAANLVLGGQKECVWGCLGFATCVKVCPFDALAMSKEGLPVVDINNCKACNKCVEICPKKLFTLAPVSASVSVACSSHDTAKETKSLCPAGCIACSLCVKACKFDAIHVVDNCALIDYAKCTSCGACVKVCPIKCIKV